VWISASLLQDLLGCACLGATHTATVLTQPGPKLRGRCTSLQLHMRGDAHMHGCNERLLLAQNLETCSQAVQLVQPTNRLY